MDLNATIDIIVKDLNEAREIIDDLKRYPGVPELQVELAKSKCKSASEVISLFKNLPVRGAPVREEKIISREEVSQKKDTGIPDPVAPLPVKDNIKVVETRIHEASPVAKEKPEQTLKKSGEAAIIADQFSDRPESFNETLGSFKHQDDVLEILKTKPLVSLDEAIGVNDKFVFIREIFDGNADLYNQVIVKLETVGSLADARAVVMSYASENTENEAIKQLLDLIKRKFPSNE